MSAAPSPSVRQPFPRSLALRVGSFFAPAGQDAARTACIAELPNAGAANPWDIDAILALAETYDSEQSAAAILSALPDAFGVAPDGADVEGLLTETLAAAHVRVREPRLGVHAQAHVSLLCARARRYYIAQAPSTPVYLLRDDILRPLTSEPGVRRVLIRGDQGADLEPEIVTGHLEDGDALLICSRNLHEALSDRQVREILCHSASPAAAAERLTREAAEHGAASPAVAILFAGVGPALASRLRSPLATAAADEARMAEAAPGPGKNGKPVGAIPTAVAGVIGALAGLGIGAWVMTMLIRPPAAPQPQSALPPYPPITAPDAPPAPPERSAFASIGSSRDAAPASPEAPRGPQSPDQTRAPNAGPQTAIAVPGIAGAAPTGPASSPTPVSPGTPLAPSAPAAPAAGARPVGLVEPPVQAPAAPAAGIVLSMRMHPDSTDVAISIENGVLYEGASTEGAAVGEAIAAPLPPDARGPGGDQGEIRFSSGGRPVGAVRGETLKQLLQGQPVAIPGLRPAEYELSWWKPGMEPRAATFFTLRVGAAP